MKWGILATGSIARKFASTINQMEGEGEVLKAVGSRRMESAEAFAREFQIERFYDSYEAFVQDEEIEAVYISTPNNMHFENAVMCLQAGKHVLCEKPFTLKADEARELYDLAEKKGLFIMEAFWIRFLPVLKKARELVQMDVIGDLSYIRSEYGFIAKGVRKDRKFDANLGGGALLDIGIYNLGFVQMMMNEAPLRFTSQVHMNEYGTDDFSSVLLDYGSGKSVVVTTSIGMEMNRDAVICGSKGTIHFPDFQHAQKMTVHLYGDEDYDVEVPFDVNGFEYQIREVTRCVKAGMSTSDCLCKEDSLGVLKLMEEIRGEWGMGF